MLLELCQSARSAASRLALAPTPQKNAALLRLAALLRERQTEILSANQVDIEAGRQAGLTPALLDRLALNEARLAGIASDLRDVAALPDPVGETFDEAHLPNGLRVHKARVPVGVLAVIYEARPNVTIDVAGLALKTGNAVILRGGKETITSNRTLVKVVHQALEENNIPVEAVQFIDDPDRQRVVELLKMHQYIDMVIPRGGAALHQLCREISQIPVITGGIGVCHLFVDESADLERALPVIRNAKIQRPTVCNALDTVLVHRAVAAQFLPRLVETLAADGVTFRAGPQAYRILTGQPEGRVFPAGPEDFDTEWLSLVLGLQVVDGLEQAMAHIAAHSTAHSDGILTDNLSNARRFVAEVDSAVVYVNASTRFTDGGQLGLGAEVAVSTQRLHARGPMGLRELTTYKWVVEGDYHVRA
ncbi:MAG: glutamate-5-semialdehyde dehydrogenase [Chloroflexi bacterium]|nr:glutamate-5-semialdehyde dehydrogenase [Chloroflexota bacterium]